MTTFSLSRRHDAFPKSLWIPIFAISACVFQETHDNVLPILSMPFPLAHCYYAITWRSRLNTLRPIHLPLHHWALKYPEETPWLLASCWGASGQEGAGFGPHSGMGPWCGRSRRAMMSWHRETWTNGCHFAKRIIECTIVKCIHVESLFEFAPWTIG